METFPPANRIPDYNRAQFQSNAMKSATTAMYETLHCSIGADWYDRYGGVYSNNLNIPTNDAKWTFLHHAVSLNNMELVKTLVTGGANVNAQTTSYSTPAMLAAIRGHSDMVLYFLEHCDVDLTLRNVYSQSLGFLVAAKCNRAVMEVVLKRHHESIAREVDTHRNTIFHMVVMNKSAMEILPLVAEYCGDKVLWNSNHFGHTAMSSVIFGGAMDAAKWIVCHEMDNGQFANVILQHCHIFPRTLQDQWVTLIHLWNVQHGDLDGTLQAIPLELLHMLLCTLFLEY